MTNLEGEIIQNKENSFIDGTPNIVTKYLGKVFERGKDVIKERIIAGKEIEAWKRDCWPWHMFSHGGGCIENNLISGSLGFLDFTRYNLSTPREIKVDFAYFGSDALVVSTLGIEPRGCTRLRSDTRIQEGIDPAEMVCKSMIEHLRKIAKERNIQVIGIEQGSLYNFYPGVCTDRSPESTQKVYSAIGNFQRFKDKKGKQLDKLGGLFDRRHLALYGLVD